LGKVSSGRERGLNMEEVTYKNDFDEKEEDQYEKEPIQFWEKRQRELLTSVVDYNLATINDLITNKSINLSPRYQRRFRWDDSRQSKLIESFLMNVPVPPIFLNEDKYGEYSIIDGKQRLSAIHNFMRGRLVLKDLEVFGDINGMTYDNLPVPLQTIIKTRVTLRSIIILRQSDPLIKFEVFRRLNTGGVKLNAQEIRNSVYPGPLNELILDLSEEKQFHKMLGIKQKEKSAVSQEMRDAELVLRYFTFRDTWNDFSGGMRRYLDEFMDKNQKISPNKIGDMRQDFLNTLNVVESAFGEHVFQRWLPDRQQWRQMVLASVYDAQMFACQGLSEDRVRSRQKELIVGLKSLFDDLEFRRTIDAATNTPSFFKRRIVLMKKMIDSII
jgi:hypothetical protein